MAALRVKGNLFIEENYQYHIPVSGKGKLTVAFSIWYDSLVLHQNVSGNC